jgi:hypothetical protein
MKNDNDMALLKAKAQITHFKPRQSMRMNAKIH